MKLLQKIKEWLSKPEKQEEIKLVEKEEESPPKSEVDLDEERRSLARQNFNKTGSHLTLRELNDVLYNAGFGFQVDMLTKDCLSVDASFDLMYYVQLNLYFYDVYFTTLDVDSHWADAWYDDQLVLLEGAERERVLKLMKEPMPEEVLVLQFVGLRNYNPDWGIVVCRSFKYSFFLFSSLGHPKSKLK
jgi:hypothetical protein